MNYQELQRVTPAGPLHSGKSKKAEDRNAYENIAMLYTGLQEYSKALKNAALDVPEEVTKISKTMRILGKALRGNTQDVSGRDLNEAEESISNGTLEQEMGSLLEKLKTGEGIVADEPVRKNLTELLQRCGASLEMKTLDIPEEYRENAMRINDKIKLSKIEAAREEEEANVREKKEDRPDPAAQAAEERRRRQDAKIQGIWDYEDGETPTARAYIDAMRRKIGSPEFLSMDNVEQKKLVMSVLAARMAVNAARNNKGSLLDTPLGKDAFREAYDKVSGSEGINAYLDNWTGMYLQGRMMQKGHGGVFMDDIKNWLNAKDTVSRNFVPEYFMPSALDRTNRLINDIRGTEDITNEALYNNVVGIFAARRTVNAERNNKATLSGKLEPSSLDDSLKLVKADGTLKRFVEENRDALIALSKQRGHGGAMEDLYRKHLAAMDTLPADVPRHLMPTVHERVTALQSKIDSRDFRRLSIEDQKKVYKELFIARMAGNVTQGSKDDTKTHIHPKSYELAAAELRNNEKLNSWLDRVIANGKAPKYALKGHAGLLERSFIAAMSRERTEPKVPARYKNGQFIRAEEEPEMEIDLEASGKNDLDIEEAPKEIRKTIQENYMTDNRLDNKLLKEDEDMIRYLAAKSMYVATVLTNARSPKNGRPYLEKMSKGDVADREIQSFMKSEAFDKMFEKHGVTGMAQLIYRGGAYVGEAYKKEQDILNVNAIPEEDEEYLEEKDEKLIENAEEKKAEGSEININNVGI